MQLEKKDWERVRAEAREQLKQAAIMEAVNQDIFDRAEREIKIAEEAEKRITKEGNATSEKDKKIGG